MLKVNYSFFVSYTVVGYSPSVVFVLTYYFLNVFIRIHISGSVLYGNNLGLSQSDHNGEAAELLR